MPSRLPNPFINNAMIDSTLGDQIEVDLREVVAAYRSRRAAKTPRDLAMDAMAILEEISR